MFGLSGNVELFGQIYIFVSVCMVFMQDELLQSKDSR